MAEVAAIIALLQTITAHLIKKLNLHVDVKREMEFIKDWLTSMQAFMEANSGRHDSEKAMLDFLQKVRKTTFDLEDVVDEFDLLVTCSFNIFERKIRTVDLSKKIVRIKKEIDTLMKQSYLASNSMNPPPSTSTSSRPRTSVHLREDEMVGYENVKQEFVKKLVGGEKRLVTLAVDGPPASGKTTFVKSIITQERIKKEFQAIAFVSHEGDLDLVQKVCVSMNVPEDNDAVLTNSETRLQRFLDRKNKYLIVVDDVGRVDDDLKKLKESLENPKSSSSRSRSRIIVINRSSDVSSICARQNVFRLQGLEHSEAQKLFLRRAFGHGRECPPELEDVSEEILARCEGLPHAIVAVASALKQKTQNKYEWKRFLDDLDNAIWNNDHNLGAINDSVHRSYMDLSSEVKSCLLYMSIFPEGCSVGRGRLVRLWAAERFALGTDRKTAEEVAEEYLNQLTHANLISSSGFDGCRVSRNVLNFILRKSEDESRASVSSEVLQTAGKRVRRLSFHGHCQALPEKGFAATLRSMFLFRLEEEKHPLDSDFERNMRKLKLIKVVDVQGANLTKFGKEITLRLALLRYLSFRDTKIEKIPTTIHKLSHLETLDLKRTHVTKLPSEISNLQNLRHVLASNVSINHDSEEGVELAEGIISKLTELQSLSLIKVSPNGGVLKDLKALTKLRKLGLTGLRTEQGKDLCAALESMKRLETLHITAAEGQHLELEETMENPPKSLQRLYLEGGLSKIPGWFSELNRAVRIDLKGCALNLSPFDALKGLQSLRELRLVQCYSEKKLRFEGKGFNMLEIIVMEDLENLERLKIGRGAAPELKKISVRRSRRRRRPFRVGGHGHQWGDFIDRFVRHLRSFDGVDAIFRVLPF